MAPYILPKMKFSGYSMKAPFKTLLVLVRPMAEVFITAISALERTPSAPVFNYAELDELAEREIRSLGDTFPESKERCMSADVVSTIMKERLPSPQLCD